MIWVRGEIVPDDALKVSVLDRTFEHGLGLFETLRTWNGRPTLLDRHRERLRKSASELHVPLDESALPDDRAVLALIEAEGFSGDAMLRITLAGGRNESEAASLWMRRMPLPPPMPPGGARLRWSPLGLSRSDPMARHKGLNYWSRRLAFEEARRFLCDEALRRTDDGLVWEGCRTNLFVVLGGSLVTPGLTGPIVPGIMRGLVLERAEALDMPAREDDLTAEAVRSASEIFLTNAVRGIIPVGSLDESPRAAPGPVTRRLRDDLWRWLTREEPLE